MNDDRAIEIHEAGPPVQDLSWDAPGEPLYPQYAAPPPGAPGVPGAPGAPEAPGASGAPEPPAGPAPRKRRRWRFVPRSLASRLVAFVVALVIAVVAAAGAATYVALKSFLFDRLDQQVTTLATSNVGAVQESLFRCRISPCPIAFNANGVSAPQQEWIAVFDSSGNQLVQIPNNPRQMLSVMELSAQQRQELLADPQSLHTWTTADGATLRVAARSTDAYLVVSGLSTDEVSRTLHRLVWLEIGIGALAVAAALALTTWGVHLNLRPLNRVTRTAREVTAELSPDGAGLDRRVPEGDPETEVGQLADSFNSLMGTVETQFAARVESERRMRQFLADASHELRTPLTSIRGYAELARMRRATGEPEHGDTLDRIESEGTRMSRLVDDLLLLARGDQDSPPQRELVDVSELTEDAVEGARAAFPGRRIDVSAPPSLQLVGDPDQLLRALRNLINNAAVHTDPSGAIRVTAHAEGSDVVVRVTDSGPGLPPEQAQHVFERFWRADKARSRARGGSGLGLAIVAQIVQAHEGTVDFESTVEGGSTVTVRLPNDIELPAPA